MLKSIIGLFRGRSAKPTTVDVHPNKADAVEGKNVVDQIGDEVPDQPEVAEFEDIADQFNHEVPVSVYCDWKEASVDVVFFFNNAIKELGAKPLTEEEKDYLIMLGDDERETDLIGIEEIAKQMILYLRDRGLHILQEQPGDDSYIFYIMNSALYARWANVFFSEYCWLAPVEKEMQLAGFEDCAETCFKPRPWRDK